MVLDTGRGYEVEKDSTSTEDLQTDVIGLREDEYGNLYKNHLIEQYKLLVNTAENVSSRRQTANTFFLSVCTLLLSGLGVALSFVDDLESQEALMGAFVSGAGILVSCRWIKLIDSYRSLNSAKFAVIHDIERFLPLRVFTVEWEKLGKGEDHSKYVRLTVVERCIPLIFLTVFSVLMVVSLAIFLYPHVEGFLQELLLVAS